MVATRASEEMLTGLTGPRIFASEARGLAKSTQTRWSPLSSRSFVSAASVLLASVIDWLAGDWGEVRSCQVRGL